MARTDVATRTGDGGGSGDGEMPRKKTSYVSDHPEPPEALTSRSHPLKIHDYDSDLAYKLRQTPE
ncbi:hypothetical protein Ancab_023365 [Ancistrocladus abbreviatus]